MSSTLSGEAGSAELMAFAKRLGLKPEWLQHAGKCSEHFDLVPARRARAVEFGAREVSRREMVERDERRLEDKLREIETEHPPQ